MKRTKGSRSEIGMLYQYGVTTILAAELSENNQIDDYVVYSSENSAGKFDDVVARIKLKNQDDWYLSLIQVKYKETKKLNVSDNLKGKRIERFLSDYIQCFSEILDNPELACREGIPSDNIRFAILCDKGIQMPVFLRQDCTFQLKVCPFYGEDNIVNNTVLPFGNRYWKFVCKDLEKSEHQLFFDRCCLFLEQPNCNKFNKQIEKVCGISDAKQIINYVKDFFNDDDLYKRGLSKEVFEIELQRIRLHDAIPPLTALEDLGDDVRVGIWNKITAEHDITAVSDVSDFIIDPSLYSCLMSKLNSLLNIDIDWKTHISKTKDIPSEIIKKFIAHSKTKKCRYWIDPPHTLQLLIIELWKCGDLPLILKTRINVKEFERYAHLKRSYIIIDDWTGVSSSKLKIFRCLNTIANLDLQEMMLKSTLISMQGREPVTLKDLLTDDRELMSTFTCVDLLRMMRKKTPFLKEDYFKGSNYLAFVIEDERCTEISERIEPYAIGHNITVSYPPNRTDECLKKIQAHSVIYENYTIYRLRRIGEKLILIEGDPFMLRHLFVDQYGDPVFISNENELFPIIGQSIKLNELQYIHRKLKRVTLPRSFLSNHARTQICFLSGDLTSFGQNLEMTTNLDCIITNETISLERRSYYVKIDEREKREYYWRRLRRLGYPLLDVYVKDGRLDLLRFQHCSDLEMYISYDDGGKCTEEEFFNEIRNDADEEIAVVTGDAGIGKTSLLKWLCNSYLTRDYVIFYDLINLQIDLGKCQREKIDAIDFILQKILKSAPKIYVTIVASLLRRKKLIWVLDSFDEIRLACERQVLDFVRSIVDTEARIVIATRTENCHILMREFGVRLIKIEPLEEKERSLYWQLSEDLLANVSLELATNPLYLNFLRLISINRERLSNITKFTLYRKVIDMKIRRCLQTTYRIVHDSEIERTVCQFERLALVAMFGKEVIEQELYWTVDKEVTDMSKFGIITGFDERAYPIFYHRSFAEFLVAQWIAKAHKVNTYRNTARRFYKQIFHENKLHTLNILTEDVELHAIVLQADVYRLREVIEEDPTCWDTVDKLGRTPLHVAVINCRWVSRLSAAAYQMLEFVLTSMLKSGEDMRKSDTIMDWNWSEYVQHETFEYACVFQKMEVIKTYLHLHRKKVERYNYPTTVFPTNYFNMLFRTAIKFTSIEMIADLVFLQNSDNKTFYMFYQACLGLQMAKHARLWTKDIRFEGQLSPMHVACIYGSISMMRKLIQLGFDVNVVDAFTYTPLYYCILRCSLFRSEIMDGNGSNQGIDLVKSILEAGAVLDPYILPTNEISPLCLAVQTGNVQVVRILLANGADVHRSCAGKDTPLHLAARAGDASIVGCLLDYKAPPFSENERGETPIDIAIKHDHTEVIDLLRTRRDISTDIDMEDSGEYIELANRDVGFGGTPLHDAVCSGANLDLIDGLLSESGGDVNVRNGNGFTPLHAALNWSDAQLVEFLLSRGAAVDAQDKYGFTPLLVAVGNGNQHIIEMILEKGANPNIANTFTITPLYVAVSERNIDVVKLLLNRGANVNVQRIDGVTPLYEAVRNGDVDVAALLLENGADTEISDEYDSTPLHTSICARNKEMSELLLRYGANLHIPNKEGHVPLYLATFKEDIDTVRLLLEKGARVNDESTDGYTPLHVAVTFGNENIVRLLLEKGADVNAKTTQGESVLFLATTSDKETDIVALLLEAGVDLDRHGGGNALGLIISKGDIKALKLLISRDVLGGVNAWDEYGHTPLHLAAEKGHTHIVDYLLERGARINATSLMNYTPLHHAVREEQEHVVKLLVDKGANINTENETCRTAFTLAIATRSANIIKILLEARKVNIDHDCAIDTLKFAVCSGDVSIIKLLLNKDVSIVNIHVEYACTLLYIATVRGDADVMEMLLENITIANEVLTSIRALKDDEVGIARFLLERGASVDVFVEGNTPLHLKVAEGHVAFVTILIEKGAADINLKNELGKTALEIAINCEYTNIVELLIQAGADVNALTSKGGSILRLAAQKQNVHLVELLLQKEASMIIDEANGITLLHECARESNIVVLKLLLERMVDLSIQDNVGNTALHVSIIEENLDVVALLSNGNADPYITNYNGKTPLHLAKCKRCRNVARSSVGDIRSDDIQQDQAEIDEDSIDVIWSLLENMKEINVNNDDVVETFYWAAEQGHSKIVKLLLHNGMNINIQDQYGYTALHLGVNSNNKDIVEMLLEQGADVHLVNNRGAAPLDTARSRGYENIVEIIIGSDVRMG